MNDRPRVSRPVLNASVRPFGVFNEELPFGAPPSVLDKRSSKERLPEELRRTVRALTNNAEKIRSRSPLIAAQCWHEAARLLHLRAGRLKDAWICYNRALAVFPDHMPSLTALTELARTACDRDVPTALLDARIERTVSIPEKTALLTETAAALIRAGDFAAAKKRLKTAVALSDDAVVPRILLAVISGTVPDPNRIELLEPLHRALPGSRIARAIDRHAALAEDIKDEETAALPIPFPEDEADVPLLWIRFHTCLRRNRPIEALDTLDRLCDLVEEGAVRRAIVRLMGNLCRMLNVPVRRELEEGDDFFHDFVDAQLAGDAIMEDRTLKALKRRVRSKPLKDALSLYHMIRRRRPNSASRLSFGTAGPWSVDGAALLDFLNMDAPPDPRDPEADAEALFSALGSGDPKNTAAVLRRLRENTMDADAEWPIKVAECALEIDGAAEDGASVAFSGLKDEETHRSPLPSIVRRTERRHRRLAELSLGEARNSDDPRFVASRLAWAAYHLEGLDPFESARLYTEALSCDASLLFAVKGLERTGTMGREAATLYQCAAEAARDESIRAAALLRAAILFTSIHAHAEAAPLFAEAAALMPEEDGLQRIAIRAALTYPKGVGKNAALRFSEGKAKGVSPFLEASLCLFSKPTQASLRFEEMLEKQPDDSISLLGLTEARLPGDRGAIVFKSLFDQLHRAGSDREKAFYVQRLAHIDRFYRDDDASAVHFAESLVDLLPGHRTTLARLLVHYLVHRQPDDLRRVLTAAALSVSSDDDAAALARLCTLSDPAKTDLLSLVNTQPRATVLELTAGEVLTRDPDERLRLLQKITERIPQAGTYAARAADVYAEEEDFAEASAAYKIAMESRPAVFHSLHRMTACLVADGASDGLVLDTMINAADLWHVGPFKAQALYKAAQFACEKMDNFEKAVDLCLLALHADPEDTDAFSLADNLLTTVVHAPESHLRLLETRIQGYCDPVDEITVRMKIRSLLAQTPSPGSGEKRAEHLRVAVSIARENRPSPTDEKDSSQECIKVWDEAVYNSVTNARLSEGRAADPSFYAAFGRLYLRDLGDAARAEMYLEEALHLDEDFPEAVSDYADILLKKGESARASEYLAKLTDAPLAPDEKLEKLLLNAAILAESLDNLKEAEHVLREARKTAPTAIEPVEALADLYEQQADASALHVHLDSSLASHAEALRDAPDNLLLYENIRIIATRKKDSRAAETASQMIALLSGQGRGEPKPSWGLRPDAKITDPSIDEQICPFPVSIGLRTVMKLLELPLARMLGAAADQQNTADFEKPRRRDKVAATAAKLAPIFGIVNPQIRVSRTPKLHISPGPEPLVLVPEAVLISDSPGAKRFALAAAFQWCRLGLALTTALPPRRFARLLAALMRLIDNEYRSPNIAEQRLAADAAAISTSISKDLLSQLAPFYRDIRIAAETETLDTVTAAIGHRAGLFAAGSLSAAAAGLRAVTGVFSGPLESLPGADMLVSFAFSRNFSEILRGFERK